MSRAFVKEKDDTFDGLPDRPVSVHPNFVTAEGLELIEAAVARLHQERHSVRADDRAVQARIARDLRYWVARQSSARVVRAPRDSDVVRFGCTVTLDRDDGRRQTFRIVGEDEADPTRWTLCHMSPVAQALMGKRVGETVTVGASDAEILRIESSGK